MVRDKANTRCIKWAAALTVLAVLTFVSGPATVEAGTGSGTGDPTCQEICTQRAEKAYLNCREHGGTEEECLQEMNAVIEECLAGCEEPPPPPTCEQACEEHAQHTFENCLKNEPGDEGMIPEQSGGGFSVYLPPVMHMGWYWY